MRKKLSFLSGLAAAALFVFPFATNTYAAETNSLETPVAEAVYGVPSDVYGGGVPVDVYGGGVPVDVYGGGVPVDVYGGEVPVDVYGEVPSDVYGEVPSDVYGEVPSDVYGEVPSDVYGEVPGDVYGEVPSDVYGEVPGDVYGDVTEDVYFDFQPIFPERVVDGEITLPYTQENISVDSFISQEDYEQILKDNPNAKIVINKGNVKVDLPLSLFPAEKFFTFSVEKRNVSLNDSVSLSPVYDFTIGVEESSNISEFGNSPVQLTFTIDPKKVTNWDNVKVYFIDEDGNKEEVKNVKINKDSGVVEAFVTHFSSYGVFEVTPTSTGGNNNNGGTTGNANNGSTTGTTNGNTNINTTGTGTQTSTTNGSTTTTTTTTTSATTGNALPDTATNNFNLLLTGLMLLTAGGALVIRNRKFAKTN